MLLKGAPAKSTERIDDTVINNNITAVMLHDMINRSFRSFLFPKKKCAHETRAGIFE